MGWASFFEPSTSVDPDLAELARDCLAVDPDRRPRDAGEVAGRLSDHLNRVSQRLREAELAQARAQARAAEDRKRRRLTALLAVLLVALAALGTGSYASWMRRQQEREAAAAVVLREVEVLRDKAAVEPTGDPGYWAAAQRAVDRARQLLGDAPEETIIRLAGLAGDVERGLEQATTDQRLIENLEIARFRADDWDLTGAAAQFAEAFREAGLDIRGGDPAALGRSVASRPGEVKDALIAALDCWTIIARNVQAGKGEKAPAWRAPLAVARAADSDPWREDLRKALEDGKLKAIVQQIQAGNIDGQRAPSLWLAGRLLFWGGQLKPARELLMRAWRLYPNDFWINLDLSMVLLFSPPEYNQALTFATSAVALRPASAVAHLRRGGIQERRGDRIDCEREYRTALRFRPDYANAHFFLALLLGIRGRHDEAANEYRESMRLKPERADSARPLLINSLMRACRHEEAVALLEPVTKKDPSNEFAWRQLAQARVRQRDGAKAAEALDHAKKLAKPGSPVSPELAAALLEVDRLKRLPALLRGENHPRDNTERLELARLCGEIGWPAAGARLFAEAIAADPKIAEDRAIRPRSEGASLSAWAGAGKSHDDPLPTQAERARLRRQANDWLRAELAAWNTALDGGPSPARQVAAMELRGWVNAQELAGVRDSAALDALSEAERNVWGALWKEVAARADVDPG